MTVYLLDTNTISYLFDVKSPLHHDIRSRFEELGEDDVTYLPILSVCGYFYGIENSKSAERRESLRLSVHLMLEELPVASISLTAAEIYGRLKKDYAARLGQILQGSNAVRKAVQRQNVDLLIIASALAEEAVLVSSDGAFSTIREAICPQLRLENWLSR